MVVMVVTYGCYGGCTEVEGSLERPHALVILELSRNQLVDLSESVYEVLHVVFC